MLGGLVALALAAGVLAAIPGPSVALIVATSIRGGVGFGLATAAGTALGIALQLLLIQSGIAALAGTWSGALAFIRWLGVAYLLYLGITTWRTPPANPGAQQAARDPAAALVWRGAVIAAINPKTALFNAAFLPQFLVAGRAPGPQLALLGCDYVLVLTIGNCIWACAAGAARARLLQYGSLANRLTGVFLAASAILLGLAHR